MSKLVFLSGRFARRGPIAIGAQRVLRLLTGAEAIRLASCGAFRIVAGHLEWVLGRRWARLSVEVAGGRRRGFARSGSTPSGRDSALKRTHPRDAAFLIGTHGHPQGDAGTGCPGSAAALGVDP